MTSCFYGNNSPQVEVWASGEWFGVFFVISTGGYYFWWPKLDFLGCVSCRIRKPELTGERFTEIFKFIVRLSALSNCPAGSTLTRILIVSTPSCLGKWEREYQKDAWVQPGRHQVVSEENQQFR